MRLRSSSCSVRNLCRSSIAENSSSASGFTRPSIDRARSAARSRLACSSRTNGVGLRRLLALGHLSGEGDERGRAVVVDQAGGVEAELLQRALLELLDAHLLLGAGHLVAVDGADELVVLAAEVAQPGAHGHELLLAPPAGLLHRGALVGGQHDRALELVEHDADGGGHRRRSGPLADQPLTALGRAGARLALGLRRRAGGSRRDR